MKKFRPCSFKWCFIYLLIFFAFLVAILGGIYAYKDYNLFIGVTCEIVCCIFFVIQLIEFLKTYILITDDFIYVPNQFRKENARVQFEEKIYFKDIINVDLISSPNNSNNKEILSGTAYRYVQKKYFEFTLKSGEKKRVWIDDYIKKQVIKMLQLIKNKCDNINIDEVMENWYSTYAQYKRLMKNKKR